MIKVAVSSRALFNFEKENEIFEKEGLEAFRRYQNAHIDEPPRPGSAFNLVRKLLLLNQIAPDTASVTIMSKNDPVTGMRVFRACAHYGLDITRGVFSGGTDNLKYLKPLGINLFLSTSDENVQEVVDFGVPAAVVFPGYEYETKDDVLRFAFDGDAVIFSEEAEQYFKENGLQAFRDNEKANMHNPLGDGPMKPFLEALNQVCQNPEVRRRIRIGLFTARDFEVAARLLHTLNHWGLSVDESMFLSGTNKGPLLKQFGADFFFDDHLKHCHSAKEDTPTGRVPWKRKP